MTKNLLFQQKQKDYVEKQKSLRDDLEKDIEEMNRVSCEVDPTSRKRTRDQLLADFDEFDDYTDSTHAEDDDLSDDSIVDADDLDDNLTSDLADEIKLSKLINCSYELQLNYFIILESSYMPCSCHNIQLVIKDGLNLSESYNLLINRVSKHIVSKSKFSILIAEELRSFNKKLSKKNLTRWNSILFMVRSVLKLSPSEFASIRSKLPTKTKSQKETKKNFTLNDNEREMLEELKVVLEMFEFVTDELQADGVTISKVYPCVNFLNNGLNKNISSHKHTQQLRKDLLKSLNARFKDIDENENYIVSSFLDSNFGIDVFEESKRSFVKNKIKNLLQIEVLKQQAKGPTIDLNTVSKKTHSVVAKRHENFIFYRNDSSCIEIDDLDRSIDEYIRMIQSSNFSCP